MANCPTFAARKRAAAALLAALPVAAVAQAPAPLPVLPTITIVGKLEQPLSEVAATVTVIDGTQIDRTLAQDARQLFRFEPGITVGADPNRFGPGAM